MGKWFYDVVYRSGVFFVKMYGFNDRIVIVKVWDRGLGFLEKGVEMDVCLVFGLKILLFIEIFRIDSVWGIKIWMILVWWLRIIYVD